MQHGRTLLFTKHSNLAPFKKQDPGLNLEMISILWNIINNHTDVQH